MSDSLHYQNDYFVVLEADQAEQILSAEELSAKLNQVLQDYNPDLPKTVTALGTRAEQALHLRDNYCELDLEEGHYLQWYAVRLEK
ncbi:MAG: chlororespiratory reduction protein 7 [Cyanobacteria bacterium RI_101]|nr:chlororespiratory reduction protein 7 [Cyanobacteria bacterium RI_101]